MLDSFSLGIWETKKNFSETDFLTPVEIYNR